MPTKIQWCEETWNPVTGCTKISAGCANCYAERMAKRLAGRHGYPKDEPFKVTLHPDRLDQPLKWKKPRKIFVCSMGDLFHKEIHEMKNKSSGIFENIMFIIRDSPRHTFLFLTKRPKIMRDCIKEYQYYADIFRWQMILPNLWLGVTCENQPTADYRLPVLATIPAAVKFISFEPLLSDIKVGSFMLSQFQWAIFGAESGPGKRPCKLEWARDLVRQCKDARVPVFVKQLNINGKIIKDINQFPDDLKIREYPRGLK